MVRALSGTCSLDVVSGYIANGELVLNEFRNK